MIRNYLKIAYRNLFKNKVYSFLNIFGLAIGMAVAMLIGLWVIDELATNKHHKNYQNLYQVKMNQTFGGHRGTQDALPYPLGEELRNKYPAFKAVANCDWGQDHSIKFGENKFIKNGHFIGKDAIEMFSLPILNGEKDPLKDPLSIVLTDEFAKILFKDQNPVGKIVRMDNVVNLKVTAIVAKQPKNATLQFNYLLPWELQEVVYAYIKNQKDQWTNNSFLIYVQTKENITEEKVNAQIKNIVLDHNKDNVLMKKTIKPLLFVFPMAKWKLYNEFKDGINQGGFIKYVKLFSLFGFIVLLIACINFMNLSTARSEKRAKEVGVRKAMGSAKSQLVLQFLSESVLISIFAFFFALFLVLALLPFFNGLTEKEMSLQIFNPIFWSIMVLFTLLTGLLAGSYPALYLSSFEPVKVLKGTIKLGRSASLPRQALVVIQYTFSIAIIIATAIIYQQIQYGKNRPMGFNNQGLITINYSDDLGKNYEALRNELLAAQAVSSICKASSPPSQIYSNNGGWEWKGSTQDDQSIIFSTIATSYDYIKTIGIKLKEGRDFSKEFASDSNGVILNESAVKVMQLKNPIGENLKWYGENRKVIGVVPDLQMESPFRQVSPLTIVFSNNWINVISVRLNPSLSTNDALKKITPIFEKFNPGFPFAYDFADLAYAKKFKAINLIGNLTFIVALLAIIISSLGLFGLAMFMAEQRTKEIGIRKVLGASVGNVTALLSKDFIKLVIISIVIASPLSYYFMNTWLNDYEYKIKIGFLVFI